MHLEYRYLLQPGHPRHTLPPICDAMQAVPRGVSTAGCTSSQAFCRSGLFFFLLPLHLVKRSIDAGCPSAQASCRSGIFTLLGLE